MYQTLCCVLGWGQWGRDGRWEVRVAWVIGQAVSAQHSTTPSGQVVSDAVMDSVK